MKLNLKRFFVLGLVFCFLAIALISVSEIGQAVSQKEVVKASTTIRATIPVYQELKIIDKKNINYSFLMQNYNGSEEIVVEKALTVEVLSNANWHLSLNNRNSNSKVMIKESNQSEYAWQNLTSTKAKFRGENGLQKISFDLKFILDQSSRSVVDNLEIDLRHNLAAETY